MYRKEEDEIMPEATTGIKITKYDPAIMKKFVGSKQPIYITIANATKDDTEYANKLLKNPDNIKQADLRDNMCIIQPNKERGWRDVLRSAKREREYQEGQEKIKALKVKPIEGIEGTMKPFKEVK